MRRHHEPDETPPFAGGVSPARAILNPVEEAVRRAIGGPDVSP